MIITKGENKHYRTLYYKLYTGQGFLSDLIAPYLYYPIGASKYEHGTYKFPT